MNDQYLTFDVGGGRYAIALLDVQEVRSPQSFTRLAGQPNGMLGIMDLRGSIAPVIDLRTKLGALASFGPHTINIIVRVHGCLYGLVVDAVYDALHVSDADIQTSANHTINPMENPDFIRGVAHSKDGLVVMLNTEAIIRSIDSTCAKEQTCLN